MGLDMYLEQEIYVGGKYEHREVSGTVDISIGKKKIQLDAKQVKTIWCEIGYWRKANQIHAWFVKNVQKGKDDCGRYDVDSDKLKELLAICKEALEKKDPAKLPPQSGFFFGSTEVDDGYWGDIQDTIKILEKAIPLSESSCIYYHSSW